MNKLIILFVLSLCIAGQSQAQSNIENRKGAEFLAVYSSQPVSIDGLSTDAVWQERSWYPMFENMLPGYVDKNDFSGQFKLSWDQQYLYVLVEITDDVLFDQHADPLYYYWDDDCLEVFLDEDNSGGDHLFNFNAFAYHVALDNQVVDMGEKEKGNKGPFLLLNDHVKSVWKRSADKPNNITWELAIKVFDDTFKPNANAKPVELTVGKTLGFMLAYCDNDGSKSRESFVGSTEIKAEKGDKNLGYKTADVFASLTLIK